VGRTINADQPYHVTEDEVTELNSEDRPAPELFRVAVSQREVFYYDSTTFNSVLGSSKHFRVLGTEIDLTWFKEDGSLDPPDGAIEPFQQSSGAMPPRDTQTDDGLTVWHLVIVLAISVSLGFGCLFLFDWFRRRHRAGGPDGSASGSHTDKR